MCATNRHYVQMYLRQREIEIRRENLKFTWNTTIRLQRKAIQLRRQPRSWGKIHSEPGRIFLQLRGFWRGCVAFLCGRTIVLQVDVKFSLRRNLLHPRGFFGRGGEIKIVVKFGGHYSESCQRDAKHTCWLNCLEGLVIFALQIKGFCRVCLAVALIRVSFSVLHCIRWSRELCPTLRKGCVFESPLRYLETGKLDKVLRAYKILLGASYSGIIYSVESSECLFSHTYHLFHLFSLLTWH